jgi:hypothetical protein
MKVIYTSALIPNKFEERKNDYINSYNELIKYIPQNNIFIIESFSSDISFFNKLGSEVFVSNTHDSTLKNKGVLEIKAMLSFFENNKFNDNDLVMKLTGRYRINDDYFIKLPEDAKNFDFYGKLIDNSTQIFTGCFIAKYSLIIEFLKSQNLMLLEENMINIEKALLDFLITKNKKCFFVDKLNLTAPIFGTGNVQIYNL